jgi:hypothetical protein
MLTCRERNGEDKTSRNSAWIVGSSPAMTIRKCVLATRSASEFYPWRGAKPANLFAIHHPPLAFFFPQKEGEAERRQTQNQPPRLRARRALSGARTPVGVPPRLLHRRTNATAQPQAALPGTWLRNGRYPSPPVPVQRASRRPVVVPAGRLPRAARERSANPPAGTALAPYSGVPREHVPLSERDIAM